MFFGFISLFRSSSIVIGVSGTTVMVPLYWICRFSSPNVTVGKMRAKKDVPHNEAHPRFGPPRHLSLQRHNAAKLPPRTCRIVCVKRLGWHMERGRGNGGIVKRRVVCRRRIHSVAIYMPQAAATTERIPFNARHAAGNGHRGQATASIENFISNACQAVRNG